MSEIRIIGQTEITTLDGGEFVLLDDSTDGSSKITPDNLVRNTAAYTGLKSDLGDLADLETEDTSSIVNAINEVASGGSGLTADIKTALLQIAQKVAYIDDDGQDYYDDLYDALYAITAITLNTNSISLQSIGATSQLTATTTPAGGNVTWSSSNTSVATVSSTGLVTSVAYGSATITASAGSVSATCSVVVAQATCTGITATYTQSGTVYDSDTLDSLKTDLVVTATWSNSTTTTLTDSDYTLSGTLATGTSTVTVSYAGQTDTFSVTVTHQQASYVTDGLVARWDGIDNTANGHDSSATTWKDLVGSYDIAVPSDSATWDPDGLVLTGTQARNVKSSSVWSPMDNTTIEIVFTPTESSTSVVATFDMHNSGAYSKGIDIYSDNTIGFVGQSSTTYSNAESSLTNIKHVACLYNGDSVAKALVNGVALELSANTHSLRHNVSYIMVGNSDSGTNYLFNGKIRAIRVYNRQLTDAELAQNLSAGRDRFSL